MRIAIVGASGAVGQEFLRVLDEQNFPIDELLLFGSSRSAGRKYTFRGKDIVVKELKHNDDFEGVDIAFTSAGAGTSREYASTITKHGAIMIDNSSAFRMDEDVPLVVPEVNGDDAFKVDVFTDNGYTKEEMKMYNETKKIMHAPSLDVSATCVRVPVMRAHSESIWIETEQPISIEQAREALSNAEGVVVLDDPAQKKYPMPLDIANEDPVYVGRLRKDLTCANGLSFWVVGDQIKKGAALNAVQIAQYMIAHGKKF